METVTSVAISPTMFVPWYKRLLNFIIDIIAIYVLALIFVACVLLLSFLGLDGLREWLAGLNETEYQFLAVIMMTVYYGVMEITLQRTVGKLITGTMVISRDGDKPSVKSIMGRSLCRIFSIEAFSFLSAYPRGWHDSASGTYVINAKKYKEALESRQSFDQIGLEQN